jgi:segregation and condensation protein B
MIFKTIENFFRSVSGFFRNSIINRLRRGKADLEDHQEKPVEYVEQRSMHQVDRTACEHRGPAPIIMEQVSHPEDLLLPAQNEHEIPAGNSQLEVGPELHVTALEGVRHQTPGGQNMHDEAPQQVQPQNLLEEHVEEGAVSSTQKRQLMSAIESLLFIAANPLSLDRLHGIFEDAPEGQIEDALKTLIQEYEMRGSGIMLVEVAGGYQLVTRPENAAWIRKFRSVKISSRLSRPALETLAIIAYKQPITRTEVEVIRGVNIGGIVRNLMERRLVKIVGKKDVPGKPMLYGTTPEFLQYFGLKDLSALPTLKEFQELEAGEEVMEEIPVEGSDTVPAEGSPAAQAAKTGPVEAAATRENATQ